MSSILNGRSLRSISPICGLTTGAALLLLAPLAHAADGKTPGQPLPAQAGDFTLKLEGGVSIPLGAPQSQEFKIGGGQTIKGLWAINSYFDLGPSATFTYLPSKTPDDPGTSWAFGAGARIKRPHDAPDNDTYAAVSPWLDVDLLYVRTGVLNRPGFAAAAGLAVPLGRSRTYWLGPFARYFQIVEGAKAGFEDTDAKILTIGLSLEMGSGIEREREPEREAAAPEPRTIVKEVVVNKEVVVTKEVCADRDQDGVPDQVDHCPDVVGQPDNWGCPEYKKIVVKRDKLELKEKLYFAWNSGTLKESSYPVLDEVVKALNDNKGFRVQVEGHSSSEGGDERNQTLSEQRASAVLDYLVAHGIAKERLVSKGFGGTVPIDTNATPGGRENNRRVEFVVHFIIVNDGSKQ